MSEERMLMLYRSVVVKMEMSKKAQLLINPSAYVSTLTYGYNIGIMTEILRFWIQFAEISFLCREAGSPLEKG